MEENLEKAKSKKTFFRDKKNIAIIVLSLLLLISIGTTTNQNNMSEKVDATLYRRNRWKKPLKRRKNYVRSTRKSI